MGRSYSLNGFLNAALRRSSRTILVEGPSDKHVLHKIELQRFPAKAGASAIDHAGILDDPALTGLGNKAKVLAVQAGAGALATQLPKIAAVLATLTDREWDGLNFAGCVPNPAWTPPLQQGSNFTTIGHSIENYRFDAECVKAYLRYMFAEHVSAALFDAVEEAFPAIIVFAAVLSLKIREEACIGRCSGLITPAHIEVRNDRFYLDPSFTVACAARQIASAATIVGDTNAAIDTAWAGLAGQDFTHWLAHGHLGEEMLWCSVAKIALRSGIDQDTWTEMAFGHKQERERFKAQWLSQLTVVQSAPLADAVEWLHR